MSKASEWTELATKRPRFEVDGLKAKINDSGLLDFSQERRVPAAREQWIEFARWILDTFGEAP